MISITLMVDLYVPETFSKILIWESLLREGNISNNQPQMEDPILHIEGVQGTVRVSILRGEKIRTKTPRMVQASLMLQKCIFFLGRGCVIFCVWRGCVIFLTIHYYHYCHYCHYSNYCHIGR